jgi:hypothetical protein
LSLDNLRLVGLMIESGEGGGAGNGGHVE